MNWLWALIWSLGAYMMRKLAWRLPGYSCDAISQQWITPGFVWVETWDWEVGRWLYWGRCRQPLWELVTPEFPFDGDISPEMEEDWERHDLAPLARY